MIPVKKLADTEEKQLLTDGYCLVSQLITPEVRQQIEAELAPWLRQIAWSDTQGYSLISGDKWLLHLAQCSKTLTQIALNEDLLNFMAQLFGEEPILAEFSLHDSTNTNPLLRFHSDRDGGMLLYLFLSEMNEKNGQFVVIPGTQEQNEHFYIPEDQLAAREKDITPVTAEAGDALLFDQDIWHKRAPGGPGRSVVKILYQPQSRIDGAVDHLLRQSMLEGLNARQLRCLGIGLPAFQRIGHLRKLGRPFWKQDLKTVFYYLTRFAFIRSPNAQTYDQYITEKLRTRPKKSRANAA